MDENNYEDISFGIKTETPDDYPTWVSSAPILPGLTHEIHPEIKKEIIETSTDVGIGNLSSTFIPHRGINLSFSRDLAPFQYIAENRPYTDYGFRFKCLICKDTYLASYDYSDHLLNTPCGYIAERRCYPAKISKRKPYNFRCSLCYRRYTSFGHLYQHQVRRCPKRYVSQNWVVKI